MIEILARIFKIHRHNFLEVYKSGHDLKSYPDCKKIREISPFNEIAELIFLSKLKLKPVFGNQKRLPLKIVRAAFIENVFCELFGVICIRI